MSTPQPRARDGATLRIATWNLERPSLRGHTRTQAALAGTNAAVVGLLLAALYQPVWQSAVLAPTDLALAAVGFYLLRVPRLPVLPLAALLTGAALLLA